MSTAMWFESHTPVVEQMNRMCETVLDGVQKLGILRFSRKDDLFPEERLFLDEAAIAANQLEVLAFIAWRSVKEGIPMQSQLVKRLQNLFRDTDQNIIENPIFDFMGQDIRNRLIDANTTLSQVICYYNMANSPELEQMFGGAQENG